VPVGADYVQAAGSDDLIAQTPVWTTQPDVRATTGHVGRDGHGAWHSGLRDQCGFLRIVLSVEQLEVHALRSQQPSESLRLRDARGPDEHRLAVGVDPLELGLQSGNTGVHEALQP